MIPLLNVSVSATSYTAGMCSRNAVRIGVIASLSQKSVSGVHSRVSFGSPPSLRRASPPGVAAAPGPTASDRRFPPFPFDARSPSSSNDSARRRSRSFSSCSMSSCSALQVCRLVTITADRSCMTKNAPHTTTRAYHSNTGQPRPSIST